MSPQKTPKRWACDEFMTSLRAGRHGFQVPSPTQVSKSQLVWPQVITKIWLNIIKVGSWLFYAKMFMGLGLRVGSNVLFDPIRNTSPKPHLQKVLPCRHPCHRWDSGLETMCEVVSPNFSFFGETKGRHASAKAQEALDHLASILSSREEISKPEIEPATSSLRFRHLSTII